MWKKCFIYPFPHLLFSLWSFLFDGGYTKCLGLITMSLLYWHQHLQILFQKVSSILMLTVFFWWRIDFWRIILGSVLRPLCQFSPKSQTSSQVSINLLCKLIASYVWLVYDGWAATLCLGHLRSLVASSYIMCRLACCHKTIWWGWSVTPCTRKIFCFLGKH